MLLYIYTISVFFLLIKIVDWNYIKYLFEFKWCMNDQDFQSMAISMQNSNLLDALLRLLF